MIGHDLPNDESSWTVRESKALAGLWRQQQDAGIFGLKDQCSLTDKFAHRARTKGTCWLTAATAADISCKQTHGDQTEFTERQQDHD